jgi:hypothetical protein
VDLVEDKRRRIDVILEPEYLEGLGELELDEVRGRRDTAEDVEAQISYYRRLLHGRMDLLDFEQRRRRGEEQRSIIEALPEILAKGMILGSEPTLRHIETMPPLPSVTGRRLIDKIMDDGVVANLPELSDDEITEAIDRLREAETELSGQRRQLHQVIDTIQDEIVSRYRSQQDEAPVNS